MYGFWAPNFIVAVSLDPLGIDRVGRSVSRYDYTYTDT